MIQINSESGNFARLWNEYKDGFGDATTGEFWLGLENIHQITSQGNWSLDVALERNNGTKQVVNFGTFRVGNEASDYTLSIGKFDGGSTGLSDLGHYHNNKRFSTLDRDNDGHPTSCASHYYGTGWWYNPSCYQFHLNLPPGKIVYSGKGSGSGIYQKAMMVLKGSGKSLFQFYL